MPSSSLVSEVYLKAVYFPPFSQGSLHFIHCSIPWSWHTLEMPRTALLLRTITEALYPRVDNSKSFNLCFLF